MKLKGRLSASLILVLALLGTGALFYYANQFKKDSVLTLQTKLQEMELQRLEEEKGRQASQFALDASETLKRLFEQIQKKAETVADSGFLRQPHPKPNLRQIKAKAFLQWMKSEPAWLNAALTDETGTVIAAAPGIAPNLAATPEFKEAAKQRMTVLRLQEKKGRELLLQITVPCLGTLGEFLGVFQASTELTPGILDQLPKKTGVFFILGTPAGRRLTEIALENFPNNLGGLLGKNLQQMESFIARPGADYFKADWSGTHYLIGSAQTSLPGLMVFSLLEVSNLQKLLGSSSGSADSFFKDPVIMGGLASILILGLILIFLTAGAGDDRKPEHLNRALAEAMQAGPPWPEMPKLGGRSWEELAETTQTLLQKITAQTGAPAQVMVQDDAALKRLNAQLESLNQDRERLAGENRRLVEQTESLAEQNRQLAEKSSSLPAVSAAAELSPGWSWSEASQIRIEAIVNMSDDLKATLTVIKNYISSILASEEGKITDTQQEFLGVVINKSARLERQINDFLDFSHLETEALQMFLVPTDIVAMLQDVLLNVQPQADTKQIRLLQDISSQLPKIMLNSDRLGQVFINLIQHALRVTQVGGEVRCIATQLGDEVVIKVIDGGTPLTPDQAEQVFLNFHGPDSAVGPLLAGTGLRFPIMKGIIAAHHGSIFIRGLADQGNEMIIKLPVTPEEREQAPVVPEPQGQAADAAAESSREQFFDLSAFMDPKDAKESPAVPGADDSLDDLLRNIESIDEKTEG